jgi:hypothetical protein
MLTICTRWETSQMPAELEWCMWRQLRNAFKVKRLVFAPVIEEAKRLNAEQYNTMEEALAACAGPKVFLEPTGDKALSDVEWGADNLTLVLGNTEHSNKHLVTPDDLSVNIKTPQRTVLYGINAAAIALAYKVGQ